jgi:hypothetical protein
LWIDARALKFRFIPGYVVPENSPSTASDNSASWVNAMAAAFNGGFMLSDHSGGYYYDGRLVQKMQPGFATLTVTKRGSMSISSWAGGEQIPTVDAAVRQNLKLMIVNSVVQPNVPRRRPAWGWPTHGLFISNRSALGELANGTFVYEYGYKVLPEAMARVMQSAGAQTAMSLDMNGSWPMAFTYTHAPHLVGRRLDPHEYHDPSIYYARYRKDFIAALLP